MFGLWKSDVRKLLNALADRLEKQYVRDGYGAKISGERAAREIVMALRETGKELGR